MDQFCLAPYMLRANISHVHMRYPANHFHELNQFFYQLNDIDYCVQLTHRGRVTHICVGKLTIIGSDNGLSPCRRQAIIWTNAGILLIGHLGTNFSDIFIEIHTFSFKKIDLKISSGKWRLSCLGLNVLSPALYNQSFGIPHPSCGDLLLSTSQSCSIIKRFWNPTITDTITVSEQPHVTSSLSVFVNAKPVESCFE